MKLTFTLIFCLLLTLFNLNCYTSLFGQFLIADYPLTTNSIDRTGNFGPISYGSNSTPPPTSACSNGEHDGSDAYYGTFFTPNLEPFFNKSDFQIDLDFSVSATGFMPVYLIDYLYRPIGVYISEAGMIGIKYNNSNYLYSSSHINIGTSYHVSLKYQSPNMQLLLDSVSVLNEALPPLNFDPSETRFLAADGSNAAVFNGCMNNLKIYSACTVEFTTKPTDATCNKDNGTITVSASGGSGSYQYSKDDGTTFQDQAVFSNLAQGSYQIVVQDKGGVRCKRFGKVAIKQAGGSVTFTSAHTDAPCGSITVTALGGSGSYRYSKDNGSSFQDDKVFSELAQGTYKILVQDKGGEQCISDMQQVTIVNSASDFEVKIDSVPATCNQENGSITVTASGGRDNWHYSINGGSSFQDETLFSGLAAKTYQVVVKDKGSRCYFYVQEVTIKQTGPVQFTFKHTDDSCGQSNGSITISATGGIGNYQYSKDNGTTFQDSAVFSGLVSETYQIVVRDKSTGGCRSSVQAVTITQVGGSPQFTSTPNNASCGENNGSITVTASAGSGSYKYSKDNGTTFQDNQVFSGLPAGNYQIVVKDNGGAGCKSSAQTITLTQTGGLPQFNFTSIDATCGESNGSITVAASGGSGSYKYSKNNGISFQDESVFSGLSAGSYQLIVEDKGGSHCRSSMQTITLTQTGGSTQFNFTSIDATCGEFNGSITVAASGGSGSYKYSKDNGISFQDESVFSGLSAGSYQLIVEDKGGSHCRSSMQTTKIIQTGLIQFTFRQTNTACDLSTGTITVAATGGSGSYRYSKDNGVNFQDDSFFLDLAATRYQLVVQDKGGANCKSDMQEVSLIKFGSGVKYNDVIVTSGIPYSLAARSDIGYKYFWSPSDGLDDPTSRTPTVKTQTDKTYRITITGASGCVTTDTLRVKVSQVTDDKGSAVIVPTAFTPNNNGQNDRLRPIPFRIEKLVYFRVYNRWGQMVFETKTLGEGWDGYFKGKPQPTETYSWLLECVTVGGNTIKKSGRSLLIR